MKGIYVITIAFLALWTVNEITAKEDYCEDQPEQSIWKEAFYVPGPIPTECPPGDEKFAVHLAHETDCTKFYKCNWGKPVEQNCSLMIPGDQVTRLHFNRREQVCDWPASAGCIDCPPKDRNGNWPRSKISHESDNCGKYYECINGKKCLRDCPPGTCFSRTCQDCVKYRAGGNCYPTPTGITPTGITPTGITPTDTTPTGITPTDTTPKRPHPPCKEGIRVTLKCDCNYQCQHNWWRRTSCTCLYPPWFLQD